MSDGNGKEDIFSAFASSKTTYHQRLHTAIGSKVKPSTVTTQHTSQNHLQCVTRLDKQLLL